MSEPQIVLIAFDLDDSGHPVTGSGRSVTCDGCGGVLTDQPGPDRQRLVPSPYVEVIYKKQPGDLNYIVCGRGEACFELARLADELHFTTGCGDPICTGNPCRNARLYQRM